jgi:hypothetical protein
MLPIVKKSIPIQKIIIILYNKKLVLTIQKYVENIITWQFPYPHQISKNQFLTDMTHYLIINLLNHAKDAVIAIVVFSCLMTFVKTVIPQKDYIMTGLMIWMIFNAYGNAV